MLELFRLIDWVLRLPAGLAERFNAEVRKLETEKDMRYVTSIERTAQERGLAQGRQEGRQEGREQGFLQGEASLLRRQLRRRFERLPSWADERLERASRDELESWAERLIEARALEDVFA